MSLPPAKDVATHKTTPKCVAKALYDNIADTPDELAFRKGDILTVLEQNTGGSEGWWLCSLRGRQGICPGNRLRIVVGVYDTGGAPPSPPPTPTPRQQPHPVPAHHTHHARRRSWSTQPSKVVMPRLIGDVYLYEQTHPMMIPTSPCQIPSEVYDVPRPAIPINYDTPRNWLRGSPAPSNNCLPSQDWYDVPRNHSMLTTNNGQHLQLTPSSSISSLTIDSMSSSNRSSLANMPEYDVPKSRNNNNIIIGQQTYDVPPSNPQPKELPLEWSEALDMLEKLQVEATEAISRLIGFVKPNWRTHIELAPKILDVRLGAFRLRAALHDLSEFAQGSLGNAANAHDKGIAIKLRPLVKALRDADMLVNEIISNLDTINWSANILARATELDDSHPLSNVPDSLDQLIACARTLTEDVRQTTSFIQGNSILLFKKAPPTYVKGNGVNGEWIEEYDYVKLESRESIDKKHAEIREALPTELKKSFDNVIKDDSCARNDKLKLCPMAPNDRQLVAYYATQTVTYFTYLTNAIEAFLQTVERNQPPAIFLAHGKFVVLSAHRLVYIGDTVHRNIENIEAKKKLLACSNALSDSLALTVTKTKNAASQYPSVKAVQDMVDSVVDISHVAKDLKVCMIQFASQP